jgi:murein DD-endopeptidase MepM/ murein hydrolase activator NlpD
MRVHPVLGYTKMHKGVDFAAPRGTPIYAAGEGTIEKIGPFSTYGNYVRIRHNNSIKTAYAHMQGFAPGLRDGAHVRQGQVIGYVGVTGRSTGPHLHYEVLVNNSQVNPRTVKMQCGDNLSGKDLLAFKANTKTLDRQFQTLSTSAKTAAAADTGVRRVAMLR